MKIIAMIPARLGSQRLHRKNLRHIQGTPLVQFAIQRCKSAEAFDEIWVNSESLELGQFAKVEQVAFHRRPERLASDEATSEEFVREFLEHHPCDWLVQVHSIAPLLTPQHIRNFVGDLGASDADVVLSGVPERIECLYQSQPVNFSFSTKQNSQDLLPVHRITWGITAWRRETYLRASNAGECATYAGRVSVFELDRAAGHVVKTEEDLQFAEALLKARGVDS